MYDCLGMRTKTFTTKQRYASVPSQEEKNQEKTKRFSQSSVSHYYKIYISNILYSGELKISEKLEKNVLQFALKKTYLKLLMLRRKNCINIKTI